MFATVFIFNPFAHGAASILSLLSGRRNHPALRHVKNFLMQCSSDDGDGDYRDPSPEEILDWMYAGDDDRRPEEDRYGD